MFPIPTFVIYAFGTFFAFFLTMYSIHHTRRIGKRYLFASIIFAFLTGLMTLANEYNAPIKHNVSIDTLANYTMRPSADYIGKKTSMKSISHPNPSSSKPISKKDSSAISIGQNSVVSINQQGGVTAGTVNINADIPRSIPKEKFDALKSDISLHPGEGIDINCLMSDEETFAFASQLKTLFQSSGWKVDGVNRCMYSAPMKGLIIAIKDSTSINRGNYIFQILQFAGFDAHGEIRPDTKFPVGIIVGAR
jgi:hypothetical protein